MLKVAVISENSFSSAGLVSVVNAIDDFLCVGSWRCCEDLLSNDSIHDVDILIVDLGNCVNDGKYLKIIRKNLKNMKIMGICSSLEPKFAMLALELGVVGIVTPEIENRAFVRALVKVAEGKNVLDPAISMRVIELMRENEAVRSRQEALRLTHREKQVAECVGRGLANVRIAAHLGISERTVKHYVGLLKDKLCVSNRTEIALSVNRLNLL